MGLSRLDNFLKSSRGTILYVDPNSLDATDSVENQGNSLARPFKTVQRALIEAARFSYQRGLNNDRFGKTSILLYPGDHIIDNRPGYIPDGTNNYRLRSGETSNDLPPFDLDSNFDLTAADNELWKLNSIYGGVIVPRGTSIIGMDLRKTKVRPKYIPDPVNDNIESSTIFRVTGACYFWQFSLFDADPNGVCYKDYTSNTFVPNFSHHKLTCFEYADGANAVKINDTFQSYSTTRTDLDMYYEKVGLVYGQASGRAIEPDYPSSGLDIQPKIDEYRIVGSTGASVGISSIKAGDGITASTNITVTTTSALEGLDVDTPIRIEGIGIDGYNGQFVVAERPSDTQIIYRVQNAPVNALPSPTGASLVLQSDTVSSASPYIFNISLRSVFGMCGLLADGSKADGFKSMVVAQFTGIGLQKDDRAFVKYNTTTGEWEDNTVSGNEALSTDSRAVFKPNFRNFHIKSTNNSFIQCVSIFAIGYAEHFVAENGGDMSITNSNSNFGARALIASGFRDTAFSQDDVGYITHVIPPKAVSLTETSIEFSAIDVLKTLPSDVSAVGVGSTGHLYLLNETNEAVPPENVLEGYRFGARSGETLRVLVSSAGSVTEYSARVTMPAGGDDIADPQISGTKTYTVDRSVSGINSIGSFSDGGVSNVITFTETHSFIQGESIRIISDTGQLPDGLESNSIYYAITSGLTTNRNIKVAKTLNDALNSNPLSINEKGGVLKVVSRVSDKNSGEIGHPIQYDSDNSQWYVKVATAATENTIYPIVVGLGSTSLGTATPRTFIKRRSDTRNSEDTLYRFRYVLPANSGGVVARPPIEGFILQESNTSIGSTDAEIQTYFGSGSISNVNQQRNFRFIAGANWDGGSVVNVDTELPHNLSAGSRVEIVNVRSTVNTTGAGSSGFNGTFTVTGIGSAKHFSVGLTTDPGTFSSDTSNRTGSLPYFKRKEYNKVYYAYRVEEAQKYVSGEQDGVYYLAVLNSSNNPSVSPFTAENYSQPVKELFPQIDRDNVNSDPDGSKCFAESSLIGDVIINDVKSSITKETLDYYFKESVGIAITNIHSQTGSAHTITTAIDHGLNRAVGLSIVDGGAGYGSGSAGDIYNARLVSIGSSVTGKNATAKITIDGSGTITAVTVMDGGSAYGVGNTMNVVGVATTTGFSQAVVEVSSIYNNVGDTLRVVGVASESLAGYNDLYRITSVEVGGASSVTVASASTIAGFASTISGIGLTVCGDAYLYNVGQSVSINSLNYDFTSGIATVTTASRHGLRVNQRVRFTGAGESQYNGSFIIDKLVGSAGTSFAVRIGVGTIAPTATGTIFALKEGPISHDGVVSPNDESLDGRMIPSYAGITTTLLSAITSASTEDMNLTNVSSLDVKIGDYFLIDDEIVRVKTTTSGANPIKIFRGVLGSDPATHVINSVVRKISVKPTELRRHSINRASGHTFEYVGFGPGNYSTTLPDKQDRAISAKEELLAQSTKRSAGINFYTGMNDKGISYSGNKKLSTITGREEIFDTPVQSITGEDISNLPNLNVTDATEGIFRRAVRVEGGKDNKVASEFNGPVVISNKLTVNSPKGVEANNLFLQGDATVSRRYTVGISTPALAGNPGDVVWYSDPTEGGYAGWVYTLQNDWRRFGSVSISKDLNIGIFDQVGIATTTPGLSKLLVGSGSTQFSVDENGVGIGTTANTYNLHVIGDANISTNLTIGSSITAATLFGDGNGLTNLNASATGWTNIPGGIYNTELNLVGVGTSVPTVNLEAGFVGMATTSLRAHGVADFVGLLTANNVHVSGVATISGSFDIRNTSGKITTGIVTTTNLHVGTAGTVITTQVGFGSVGIGSTLPTATLDIGGHTKFKTYSENVNYLSIVSNVVTVDLSQAQTFICTATADITQFTLTNAPAGASEFTLKIEQDGTGNRSVGIDTFKTSGGADIPVFWPAGGVLPIVTPTASRSDIYLFKIFDGVNVGTSGLYGVVVGQNFAN